MSSNAERLTECLAAMPLVAILRGVKPNESLALARTLVDAGIRIIEVPLNSPDPFASIDTIVKGLDGQALVGAGTVTEPAQVHSLHEAGGGVVVMPHADLTIIRDASDAGLAVVPGVLTPTEAFAALDAGADALKLFPAELATPPVLKAVLTVLPEGTRLMPVGGIEPDSLAGYWAAGAAGFGLGSGLYRPGRDVADVGRRAQAYVAAIEALRREGTGR